MEGNGQVHTSALGHFRDGKCKGKIYRITDHEGPEKEYMYNSTLSLTSDLDGVGGQRHAPAALPPGKTRYPWYRLG
jgi:hypothetical protein